MIGSVWITPASAPRLIARARATNPPRACRRAWPRSCSRGSRASPSSRRWCSTSGPARVVRRANSSAAIGARRCWRLTCPSACCAKHAATSTCGGASRACAPMRGVCRSPARASTSCSAISCCSGASRSIRHSARCGACSGPAGSSPSAPSAPSRCRSCATPGPRRTPTVT